jgi:capsular exopolysaccharide synthesis family protein
MAVIFHVKEPWFGFADILADHELDNGIAHVIQPTNIPNLHVIPCGNLPSNPSELLTLEKTRRIITALEKQFEHILIDSPPVNVVTDPLILSQLVNGVVLVVHAGKTKRHVAQRARDELREAGATILGGVLNDVDIKKARYNYYYYYYAYHYPKYYRKENKTTKKQKNKSRT